MPKKHQLARQVLANNLRRLRKTGSLSQESLADKAGLHRTFVGAVERCERNISLDNIERLARALRVKVAELLSETTRHEGER
jgi:transcriptional regulator with XRE-family HTH domain